MSVESEIARINTNIASAYTAANEKGATIPLQRNSANLAETIRSIQEDEPRVVSPKDVNFYDYNGTLLYSYTFAEAAALSSLPLVPSHAGLRTFSTGWNYSRKQIRDFSNSGVKLNVGATYTTDDDATRLYLFVAQGTKIPKLQIHMSLDANQTVTIDWGDGSTSVVSNSSSVAANVHAEKTDYAETDADSVLCVRIIGGVFSLGYDGTASLFGTEYEPCLIKAELGSNCTGLLPYAFYSSNLAEIVMSSVVSIPDYAFFMCNNLKAIILPSYGTAPVIGTYAFASCTNLALISFAPNTSNIASYALNGCSNLMTIALPANQLTSITNNLLRSCKNLQKISIPSSVTGIYAGAFMSCAKLYEVDLTAFSDPTALPALGNTNAFGSTPAYLKFAVKNQDMLTAFSAATNWSTYAAQFIVR